MPDQPIVTNPLPLAAAALRSAVYQALGAASVCWSDMKGQGIFMDQRARDVGDQLMAKIEELTGWTTPSLGLATTRELVAELAARFEDEGSSHPDYRTVSQTTAEENADA